MERQVTLSHTVVLEGQKLSRQIKLKGVSLSLMLTGHNEFILYLDWLVEGVPFNPSRGHIDEGAIN
jgi:hypothetical protein